MFSLIFFFRFSTFHVTNGCVYKRRRWKFVVVTVITVTWLVHRHLFWVFYLFLFLHNTKKVTFFRVSSREFRNFIKMSRLFSVVGDSNVRRNWTGLNTASRETMKTAQVIDCEALGNFEAALNEVRAESNTCIIACMTVFILSSGDCGTITSAVDPVLDSVSRRLRQFCQARQDLQVRFLPWLDGSFVLTSF